MIQNMGELDLALTALYEGADSPRRLRRKIVASSNYIVEDTPLGTVAILVDAIAPRCVICALDDERLGLMIVAAHPTIAYRCIGNGAVCDTHQHQLLELLHSHLMDAKVAVAPEVRFALSGPPQRREAMPLQ